MHERIEERSLLGGLRGQAAAAWWLEGATRRDEADPPVLELAVAWGDQLLEAGPVETGEVTLGDAPGCTVAAPIEGRHVLARPVEGGAALVAPPGCRLERWIGGVGHTCEGDLVLRAGECAVVRVGALEVALRFGAPSGRIGSAGGSIDLAFARAISFSAMGTAFLLAVVGVTPRSAPELGDPLVERRRTDTDRIVRVLPPPPKPSGASAPKAQGNEGKIGAKDKPRREAAPSKRQGAGARDHVRKFGLLAGLDDLGGAAAGVFSPGGLGGGLNAAIGGLQGSGLGEAGGLGGMNSRGVGPGGGGNGLSIGSLGTGGTGRGGRGGGIDLGAGSARRSTRIVPGQTRVIGGLSKDVIGQVIERHKAQIRACYERELQREPALQGKVAVLFTIDGTGAVAVAEASEDSVGDGAVARCMLTRIRGWRFPAPKGGGQVVVTYPWIFRAAGG